MTKRVKKDTRKLNMFGNVMHMLTRVHGYKNLFFRAILRIPSALEPRIKSVTLCIQVGDAFGRRPRRWHHHAKQ
eukprot:5915026-Pyramimonas_sp.AAC.1